MGLQLDPEHLGRYKKLAWLLFKYGRSDLVAQAGLDTVLAGEVEVQTADDASELACDLEKAGPTYIKLGQLLSTRADLVPAPYREALSRLQDRVAPVPFEEIERSVASELEGKIGTLFREFDPQPAATASLGQVHRATLRSGREVVVKVQRPNVRTDAIGDLGVLIQVADFLDRHTRAGETIGLGAVARELRRTLIGELDYLREASNLIRLRDDLDEFENIVVPEPIPDYSTSRVLTMEYIAGHKLADMHPVTMTGRDGSALADEVFAAYLKQFFVNDFFHADPHPGNVLLTQDGRIALLDLGMVGHLGSELRYNLLRLVLGLADGDGARVAQHAIEMGRAAEGFERHGFEREVADLVQEHASASIAHIPMGRVVLRVTEMAARHSLRLPAELTLVAKTLLNLDATAMALDPGFQPHAAVRHHASQIMTQQLNRGFSISHAYSSLLEAKEFVERLPSRLGKILGKLADDQLSVRVEAIDERALIETLQKIANRITAGLLLAALIVGAALMMNVQTRFTLLGYPGIAMLFFMLAAAGAARLLWSIFWTDRS